jgi:hypothetical protein
METRVYKFIGREEDLNTLEKLFRHMEYLGAIGASRNLLVRVDGDGSGRIKVRNENNEKLDNEKYNTQQNLGQGALVGIYDLG